MGVTLARSFAAQGFVALRYDLGGLGDSKAARGDLSFQERAVADTRAAMDWLERTGLARRFVVFGLCSGADNGLATALADPRVCGVAMLDPYTYVTTRSQARKLEAKLKSLGSARRIAEWGLSLGARKVRERLEARTREREPDTQSGREAPPAEVFGGWLRKLLDRNVAILAIYSGA
ncbi:MAG: serine aminopeptidase domain-containing protein, partial [Polyangiales bacterium]